MSNTVTVKTFYGPFGEQVMRSDALADTITGKAKTAALPHVHVYKNTKGRRRGATFITSSVNETRDGLLTRSAGRLR